VTKLVGVSGSLRKKSFNSALLRAAAEMVPDGVDLTIGSIRNIPLYDADVEVEQGIPKPVADLKDAIAAADGLLLVTPEYNNSVPGVLKNAVDWLSRPAEDIKRVFGGKPVAVMGVSAGGFGTVLSQNAWLSVLRHLGTAPWHGGRLLVSRAQGVFDEGGAISDEAVREQLRTFLHGFAAFAEDARSRRQR
jgi:NAD(P)H-dependent FMN reductase